MLHGSKYYYEDQPKMPIKPVVCRSKQVLPPAEQIKLLDYYVIKKPELPKTVSPLIDLDGSVSLALATMYSLT